MAMKTTKDDGKKAVATIKKATIDTTNRRITTGPARPMKMTSISASEFSKNSSSKPAAKSSASKPAAKPAAPSAAKAKAQKAAKDLQVKALQAKAQAAKSKAASSKMRSENTPMPLAKGQPVARFARAADRAMGFSGKDIMRREAMENRDTEDFYPEIYKKNKTKAEKADSAFLTNKFFDATQGTRKIEYNKVRKPKMGGKK